MRRPRVGAAGSLGHVGGRRAGGRGKALWVHAKGRSVAGDQTDLPFGGKRVRGTTTGSRGTAGQRVPPPGGRCPWPGPGWQRWAGQRETTGRGVEGVVRDRRVAQVPVRSHGRAPRRGGGHKRPHGGPQRGATGLCPQNLGEKQRAGQSQASHSLLSPSGPRPPDACGKRPATVATEGLLRAPRGKAVGTPSVSLDAQGTPPVVAGGRSR